MKHNRRGGFFHYFYKTIKKYLKRRHIKSGLLISIALLLIAGGLLILWLATLDIPNLSAFEARKVSQSTKIYDRTGQILLYDIHRDTKRTIVPYEEISSHIKNATVAIEDYEFYEHFGVKPKSFLRAVLVNMMTGSYSQGGSTITQQVVKNSLLTKEKTITRKLKEWIIAVKLERVLSKDKILSIYLNETPYGGNVYGVEEASRQFFSKKSSDLTITEAAYLAALPQAPTFYSPYGNNKDRLVQRKNLVLAKMLEHGYITPEEHAQAQTEQVTFQPRENSNIKAPHFVEYVREYLEEKYGDRALIEEGYKVITTLDFELQQKAEDIVKRFALENEKNFNASNASLAAVDPQTGDILVMVGSRDYFDKKIDGNFNITTAQRQPGSAFKPFIYAAAINKGYTSETALFDLPTEFSAQCNPDGTTKFPDAVCYSPGNYDDKFKGPMTFRTALAESRNIPAVKAMYLAGPRESLKLAKDMGISTLTDIGRYGLSLVLGGGEVSLLDITSAYGVFAQEGVRNSHRSILYIEDSKGTIIEKAQDNPITVLPRNTARQITNILSDNVARIPAFGAHSPLYFPGHDVAAKTGTTNNYRDVWVVGYTPEISVGAWAGNNDNSPMERKVAGLIIAPLWNAFMQEALLNRTHTSFIDPDPIDETLKPVLRGFWQGNVSYIIDTISGKKATQYTPLEHRQEKVVQNVHSILYWVKTEDPLGPQPTDPESDPQFSHWEYSVQNWARSMNLISEDSSVIPKDFDTIHTADAIPTVTINAPVEGVHYDKNKKITIDFSYKGKNKFSKAEIYLNNKYLGSITKSPYQFSFSPQEILELDIINTLKVTVFDIYLNKNESYVDIMFN